MTRLVNEPAWSAASIGSQEAPRGTALSWLRQRPTFLIIGAQKAGTTSLYNYLIQHPCIGRSTRKEVHYFDSADYQQGDAWYLSHFPMRWHPRDLVGRGRKSSQITGEASPYYLAHPASAARIKAFDPNMRLIVMLRDPVERALSHYHHQRRHDREDLSFEDALRAEEERLAGEREKMIADPNYYSYAYWLCGYAERGQYAKHLRHWFEHFPREQFLFIDSTAFFANPRSVYATATEFLGVASHELAATPKKNAGSYKDMSKEARQLLHQAFEASNQDLKRLLDVPFAWLT